MEKITFDNLSPTQLLILNEVDNKKVVGASVGIVLSFDKTMLSLN